jgi:nucleotide-binding universal stress UspA family protein
VLLAPEQPPAVLGERIVFGWDGSPTAVRALAAALPFIEPAGRLTLVTIGAPEAAEVPSALEYLAWHGVAATHRAVTAEGKPGLVLLAEADAAGADLLVMGGYGHPSWRELLFGGATHEVIGAGTLPVLLTH